LPRSSRPHRLRADRADGGRTINTASTVNARIAAPLTQRASGDGGDADQEDVAASASPSVPVKPFTLTAWPQSLPLTRLLSTVNRLMKKRFLAEAGPSEKNSIAA